MKYVIEILKENQKLLVEKLRQNIDRESNIENISSIKKAIMWLTKIEELKLDDVAKYEIVELPDMRTGFSEFRIMNDCETDAPKDWIEFKDHPGLVQGDFVISRTKQ